MVFREGLALAQEGGFKAHVVDFLRGLGAVAGLQGEARQAAELFGAAERLQEAVGTPNYPSGAAYQRARAAVRTKLDEANWEAAWEIGRAGSLDKAVASVLPESE
jgi:hypothetical protein